jgi:DNA-directed RNA polymerase specialized sigma24 family protein
MGSLVSTPAALLPALSGSVDPWLGLGQSRVERIIESRIGRYIRSFDGMIDWARSDLLQECLLGYFAALPRYQPSRGKPSTFITTVVDRKLKDKVKVLGRRQRREDGYAAEQRVRSHFADEESLIEWLEGVFTLASKAVDTYLPPPTSTPREGHTTLAQATSLLALQHKLGLSRPQAVALCQHRPTLWKIMGLSQPPTLAVFRHAESRMKVFKF